ncbi:MAG: hypothetical protein B7Y80_20680 [Hyphomicrobium sp. 32-62-53]|nr:MAG: hypothetical protein B7Y80_20680 [Hyphomicrobium sp. 32-62-53]
MAQIAASITEFGWTNPILVDATGTIIAGHGRLEAAKSLGMTEVPVIRLPSLTETQRQALVITDNQLALNAGWDEEALSSLLRELNAKDYNLDLLGFSSEDLERYMASLDADLIDGDIEPPIPDVPVVPVSQPGDLWILGPHRVLCGDATVLTDIEKLMDGQLADMAFLDPPYNVDYANAQKHKKRSKDRRILNDALGGDFGPFLQTVCSNVLAVTKGACYICMSSSELHTLQKAWADAGGKWSTLHPTMKPVGLVERAIRNSSKTRDTVLDLFGGSGTTLIACERTKRQGRLMELDPKYVDVIVERWQTVTGKAAVLTGDQRTFAEVKSRRSPEAREQT